MKMRLGRLVFSIALIISANASADIDDVRLVAGYAGRVMSDGDSCNFAELNDVEVMLSKLFVEGTSIEESIVSFGKKLSKIGLHTSETEEVSISWLPQLVRISFFKKSNYYNHRLNYYIECESGVIRERILSYSFSGTDGDQAE